MTAFRAGLIVFWVVLVAYTARVIAAHGMGLVPIFFDDIAAHTWPGQFNLDFFGFLLLSATWTAWRHHFSAGGLLLGVVALVGGSGFLFSYLLFLSLRTRGNVAAMLLGDRRAGAIARP